ncbi:hypothetical protein MJK72_16605 [Klebsiella pneumoniae]|nr:hypothetical protein MJK72_16605 [Klebsiella pneumoniae]
MATDHHHLRNNHRGGGKQSGIEVSPGAAAIRMLSIGNSAALARWDHCGYAGRPGSGVWRNRMANPGREGVDAVDAAGGIIVDTAAVDRCGRLQGGSVVQAIRNENAADAPVPGDSPEPLAR